MSEEKYLYVGINKSVSINFEPRDLWIGIYWNVVKYLLIGRSHLDIYVCIIPMFPIKIEIERELKDDG